MRSQVKNGHWHVATAKSGGSPATEPHSLSKLQSPDPYLSQRDVKEGTFRVEMRVTQADDLTGLGPLGTMRVAM
jgi:hypothetical protein